MFHEANKVTTCEACRLRSVAEAIGDDDPDEPYLVCGECGSRLRQRALRPREWFNLAAKHGWREYLLHDDFYNEDGTAEQPEVDGYSADGLPAPTLDEAACSLGDLVDYCMTRWHLDALEYDALRKFPPEAVLDELERRAATGNRHALEVTLKLCASVVECVAAPWVRAQYERACNHNVLFSWAEAAARCLPHPEGLNKTVDALRAYSGQELRDRKGALMWFRSSAVLDWIENHAPRANVTDDWGRLAALSDLPWSRVDAWLARGRPLSLIALDALAEFIPRPGQAPIVKQLQPKLQGNPDALTLTRALQACMAADTAPRIAGRCRYLIEHLDELRA
jgi:hypothetical protein